MVAENTLKNDAEVIEVLFENLDKHIKFCEAKHREFVSTEKSPMQMYWYGGVECLRKHRASLKRILNQIPKGDEEDGEDWQF